MGRRGWKHCSPVGQRLLETEDKLLRQTLANLFGYYLIQSGSVAQNGWLADSRVSRCMVMDFAGEGQESADGRFYGRPETLPVQSDSVDILVFPHTLEFSQNPHEVLREAERVLIPEGHLVLLTFNPWSNWNLWRYLVRWWGHRPPWCSRFYGSTRIKDWLALLGFDVVQTKGYFFRPPIQHAGIMHTELY